MSFHYLRNTEIDVKAWDNCISGAFNGSLHACSWYLNAVCNRWDALVEDQYKSVMPLIIKRYWGKYIIDLPRFSHELGIFSAEPINEEKTRNYIKSIPAQFSFYRILLNKFNPLEPGFVPVKVHKKFELDLIKPYHRLVENFDPVLRTRLNQAMARRYTLAKGVSLQELIRFITVQGIPLEKEVTLDNYRFLRTLISEMIRYKSGELYGILDQNNQLASVALFSWFYSRITLQFQYTAPGRLQDFPHLFLIDRFIEKYAETNSTLSFEFPAEPATPEKYTGFSARESHLMEISINNLPFYFRMLPSR
jgi:hypothetical protein